MGVGRSEEGSLRRWCRFNALVSVWEERQQEKALLEDEAETTSSSWLNGKEAWHGTMAWWCRLEERLHQEKERDETTLVGLTWILLGRKIKKIHTVDSKRRDNSKYLFTWIHILISCLKSERWSASSSLCVSFMRWDNECGTTVKGYDNGQWSSDGVVLWLARMQNGYVIEWWGE
jgi:hypothetical protein